MSAEPQAPDLINQIRAGMRECVNRDLLLAECPAALLASPLRDCLGLAASAEHQIYSSMPPLLLDLTVDRLDKLAIFTHFNIDSFDAMFNTTRTAERRRCWRAAVRTADLLVRHNLLVDFALVPTRFLVGFHRLSCTVNLEVLRGC